MDTPLLKIAASVLVVLWSPPMLRAQEGGEAKETRPPVFADLGYKEARAKADAEKKLFILDAMTSWCGPCKTMDRTTWRDPAVVEWIGKNAVAIQLDMDQHEEVKTALRITGFPTIVAFREGREFDRVVGLRPASTMLDWLRDVAAGRTSLERAKADLAKARGAGGAEEWSERARLAEDLLAGGDFAEATVEYVWLWTHAAKGDGQAREQQMLEVRNGLRELVVKHPPAKAQVAALRESLAAAVNEGSATEPQISEWIELNFVLDEERATVAWAAGLPDRGGEAILKRFELRLFALLIENRAWRAAGLALKDPVRMTEEQGSQLGAYDLGPGGGATSPEAMPAIPMGPPREAGAAGEPAGGAARRTGAVIPAIPMGPPRSAEPARPETEGAERPKMVPAIPLGAPRTADPEGGKEPKSVPMVPLGGGRGEEAKPARPRPARPQTPEEVAVEVRRRLTLQFRENASDRYAALLAAGRDAEAEKVAAALLETVNDRQSRAALVTQALRAGVLDRAAARHQHWLDEAAWE